MTVYDPGPVVIFNNGSYWILKQWTLALKGLRRADLSRV